MTQELPAISVVVIGRNEGERLVRCLESVRTVDYPPEKLELIYVDTDSTDDSCAVAARLGARVIQIQPERPSAAAARNTGFRAASHDLVQFLDGDTILNRLWPKKAVPALHDPTVACVFGRVEEVDPKATIYNFWAHHDWYVQPGPAESCGGNALFRRDVLENAGGFDSSLMAGEERDLCFRLIRDQGIAIISLDEPMVLHDSHMTSFWQYWRRCFRVGYGFAEVSGRCQRLRRWRRTCRRNMLHACAAVTAIVLSAALGSVWPVAIWAGLVGLAISRDALRCKRRLGSASSALLYAAHHYLSKTPTVLGHLDYYIRNATSAPPRGMIEHRGETGRARR